MNGRKKRKYTLYPLYFLKIPFALIIPYGTYPGNQIESLTQSIVSFKEFQSTKDKIIMGWNFDPNQIKITDIPIELPRLSPDFDQYKIVQISDFHLGSWLDAADLVRIVDIVNQQEPTLIAITGDFVSFNPKKFASDLINTLSKLQAHDAVIAVLGNHDHYTEPGVIRDVLKESNIIELSNDVFPIRRNASHLYFAGIDDHLAKKDDLQKVIEQIPAGSPAILLAHEPDFADISSQSEKFGLQLSGHSHGGQICIPRIGSLYLPPLGRKYPSGIYQINGMNLYTNRGLGTSWLKIRYNCPPEITNFTLQVPNRQNG